MQHPNIVQSHEVGEHHGGPFFCLEFVDGGSLAQKLGGRPLPGRQAAELVETLARAVHHAHRRRVVHRDLKPANVLLTQDGTPKITDFGLAKRLEGDAGQTQSGAVMGTPSYMAPEQAAGRVKEVGPPADVYALGAILYECLSGRPPFRAETVMATLQRVLAEEPVPPGRLQPRLHRDLETVCLKCLHKDPRRRYGSALELAEDLARFNAGEAILARREGPAGRLWRRVRRSPVTAASVLAVVVVVVIAGVAISYAGRARRQANASQAFEAALAEDDSSPAHLERLEALLADLQRVAPGQAGEARERLLNRFSRSIHNAMYAPRGLQGGDVERLRAAIDLLDSRDPERAKALREEFKARERGLQRLLDVRPPFAGLDQALDPESVRTVDNTLVASGARGPVILTRAACKGNVEFEAVFDSPSWESTSQVGLVLNAGPGQNRGYGFYLALLPPAAENKDEKPPATFQEALQRGRGSPSLQIHRDSVLQQAEPVTLAVGPLRLRATREGDGLTCQVNDQPPLTFRDPFPVAGAGEGVFGVFCPGGARLQSVQAWQQILAPAASPLETGDDFYARGQLTEALAYYREQANASPDVPVRQEARCKAALCLVGLQRLDEADQLLQDVAAEPGDDWPALAAFRLWLIRLRRQQFTEADTSFEALATRYRRDQLELVVPEDVRTSIMNVYLQRYAGANLYRILINPEALRPLERLVALQDLLFGEHGGGNNLRIKLLYAYRAAGRNREALDLTEEALRLDSDPNASGHGSELRGLVEQYGWLQRERGRVDEALAEVNHRQTAPGGGHEPEALPLLVERARLQVAARRWQEAENDLDELFRLVPAGKLDYRQFSAACLLRGFLRERRGDAAGALDSWRQGVYRNWRAEYLKVAPEVGTPSESFESGHSTDSMGVMTALVLGSLCDDLTDAEADAVLARYFATVAGDSPLAAVKGVYPIPPAVLRDMWRSPRGRDWARHFAYLDLSFADYLRVPALLMLAEIVHQEAFPDGLSADQDGLVWKTCEDALAVILGGKLGKTQMLQLLLTWKGSMDFLGWKTLAPTLAPGLRGPVAYVCGRRYLRLNRPQDAATLFRVALADAPADSSLRRLAQAELDRLPAK
jgi:tetratricopeptide (TPR) repeat protein